MNGRAELVTVGVGHRGETEVEITSGLASSESVIVHASDSVKHGVKVKPR